MIVCTASNRAYAQALDFLRFGGTLVCVGMPEGDSVPIAKSKTFPSSGHIRCSHVLSLPHLSPSSIALLRLLSRQLLTSGSTGFPAAIIAGEFNIKGSAVGNQREALEVLDMAARGLVATHLRVEKMDKLTEVFQAMSEGKMQGRVVIDLQ